MGKLRLFSLLGAFAICMLTSRSWAVDKVNAQKWLVYANAVYAQKNYDGAIAAYSNSLRLDNTNASAYQGLGNCFYAKGDKNNALKYYKYALQLNPRNTALASFVNSLSASMGMAANPANPTASPANSAAASTAASGPADWVTPAWHSAVLPGWGQFTNGESTKGLVIGGLTLGALAGTIGTYIIGSGAEAQYMSLTSPTADYDTPYNTWANMANINHMFYIAFGLLYTYNIIDAIWNAKPASRMAYLPQQQESPVQLSLLPQGGFRMDYTVLKF